MENQKESVSKLLLKITLEQFWRIYFLIACIALMNSLELLTLIYIFYGFMVLGSIKKTIAVWSDKEMRWRFSDPLYLIIMSITLLVSIGAFSYDGPKLTCLLTIGSLSIVNYILLGLTNPNYNPEEGVKNAFRVAKKCPHCFSTLPSFFTTKCPHCTSQL